jgi:crotonobetainyl-CoA:carnitine CoA-transferase CaiB-like acyl-CoA transferase
VINCGQGVIDLAEEKDTALDGLRVLEITQGMSGSLCGRLLTELGAEVIKIETPAGDGLRNLPPFKSDKIGYTFEAISSNKKGMTLDLTTERGREILKGLSKVSDILIEDHPVGTLDELGIGYDVLNKANPKLIYCSITPFGKEGPLSHKESCDIVVQAMSGVMSTTGLPEDPPTMTGFPIADFISSIYAAIGILAAVHYREGSEEGQHIDISMSDCLLSYFPTFLTKFFMTGALPARRGNRHTMCSPWNSYEANDGWVIICTANDDEWNRMIQAMERTDLKDDPRFDTVADRIKVEDEIDAIVTKWTSENTVEDITKALEDAKVAAAPIFPIDQLLKDAHFLYRGMVVEVDHPLAGKIPVVGSLFKMSETPGVIKSAAPLLGQDTEQLLIGLLDHSQKDVKDLKAKGII